MSYSNYSTYLKYKNCCRPIGDTGPPGSIGPTGPAAILDISGNKGEILYFSETDTLDSTNTIFITNDNVSINNNLLVTGNLSMNDQFINDVSGIYFSDGTYIGHGSSFDITTSEILDISAAGGISVTGNLSLNDATTVNKTLDVIGNTTLENLFVNGSINNLIEISGNTIQPIISESVNLGYDESGSSNDRRFNLGFFNKIKSRTAVIVGNLIMEDSSISNVDNISSLNNLTIDVSGATTILSNLSMDDNFINDVSGIYFSDGTYIGNGSSFDITTSQTLDISASQGLTITGNLIVNNNATFINNLTVNGNINSNIVNTPRISFPSGNYIDSDEGVGMLYVNGNTTLAHTVQLFSTLDVSGATTIHSNLSMSNQFINDVSGIYFSDNTFIGIGNSFDIKGTPGVNIYGNLLINDIMTINSTLDISGATTIHSNLSMSNQFINDVSGIYFTNGSSIKDKDGELYIDTSDVLNIYGNLFINDNVTINNTLDVSGATTIHSNLSMSGQFINDVSGIYFTKGNLLFSDFSSVNQNVQLPSSQEQPISLQRKTLICSNLSPPFSPILTLTASNSHILPLPMSSLNQLKLTINGNTIKRTPVISGQYIEIYANIDISANQNNITIYLDMSGSVDFHTSIDTINTNRRNNYYLTFGPHIITPEDNWTDTEDIQFVINSTKNIDISRYKIMFTSYFL